MKVSKLISFIWRTSTGCLSCLGATRRSPVRHDSYLRLKYLECFFRLSNISWRKANRIWRILIRIVSRPSNLKELPCDWRVHTLSLNPKISRFAEGMQSSLLYVLWWPFNLCLISNKLFPPWEWKLAENHYN